MKAVYIAEFGGAEQLEIRDVAAPTAPQKAEVIVRVHAASLNRADILQRRGLYPAPHGFPERIPGLEFAGEITACGPDASRFSVGDRVFGITAGGAQAEFLLTREEHLVEIPSNLSMIEAAAIPEAFMTANDAVFTQAQLRDDETLLIHAVGSGVGLAALQLAAAHGIRTIGTSRTADKLSRCAEFGLSEGILATESEDFAKRARELGGADVILDLVGGHYFDANLDALNSCGRLMLVGLTGGAKAEVNLGKVLGKRLRLIGTVLRSRSDAEKAQVTENFVREVVPLIVNGKIRPNIEKVLPVEEVRQAHELLESNTTFGKIVLTF